MASERGCPFSFDKLGKKQSCLEITQLPEHKITKMGLVNNTHDSYNLCSIYTFPPSCFWYLFVLGVKAGPEDPSAGAAPAAPGRALPAHPHHEIRVHRRAPLPPAPQDSGRDVSLAALTRGRCLLVGEIGIMGSFLLGWLRCLEIPALPQWCRCTVFAFRSQFHVGVFIKYEIFMI